jgi:hypothetical protein
MYANLDSRANALPHKFINYSVPGDNTAFAGGALSSDGKVCMLLLPPFPRLLNEPRQRFSLRR